MEGRVFENFQKNQKSFKVPKMPKIVPKSVQTKIFKKIKKFSNFQKCPKSSPKVSKRNFSKTKKFQISKHAQNRSQKCPNVFWRCFRVIFLKKFFAQCSMESRVFENFPKNQKIFKIPKMPKIFPKSVQTCFENVLGRFFQKKFLPSFPWRVESPKIFEKI